MPVMQRLIDIVIPWADFVPSELAYVPCNICGSFNYDVRGSLLINAIEFFLVECPKCMLQWRNPLPGDTFLSQLYRAEYFNVPESSYDLRDQVGVPDTIEKDKRFRDDISTKVVQSWIDFGVNPQDGRRLLEIGGGRGYRRKPLSEGDGIP
jgi:hypothetical protein